MFEADVATEEVALGAPCDPLLPEEQRGTERFVARRLVEFQAGRHCARRALARIGLAGRAVPRGADRAPEWPAGSVGSISHVGVPDDGWCGAAVARAEQLRSLGVDAERDEPLEPDLWRFVLTERERQDIEHLAPDLRGVVAKLVFSAKESAYKCQYPLTRRLIGFHELELQWNLEARSFSAICRTDLMPARPLGAAIHGRFVRRDGWIVTAAVLPP